MKLTSPLITIAAGLIVAAASVTAFAQAPGGGRGPGPGPQASAPAASGPGGGGPGPGPRAGRGGARWGAEHTPGWTLMTPQERDAHRDRMHAITSHDECKAAQQQHHELMAARAKERGVPLPPQPRRDACAGLKKP